MWIYIAAWAILLAVFIVVEMATENFVSIWFAGGALAGLILALLQCDIVWQCVAFIVIAAVMIAVTRPLARKIMDRKKVATNADALIGSEGVVTVDIDNLQNTGRVKVRGLDWAAQSEDGAPLQKDTVVFIKEIRGVTLIVSTVS